MAMIKSWRSTARIASWKGIRPFAFANVGAGLLALSLAYCDGEDNPLARVDETWFQLSTEAHAATSSMPESDSCTSMTKGVRSRIEVMKPLKARAEKEEKARPSTVLDLLVGNAGSDSARKEALAKLSEERHTVENLNAMLPAFGCKALDIDFELAQPPAHGALAPDADAKTKKHRKD